MKILIHRSVYGLVEMNCKKNAKSRSDDEHRLFDPAVEKVVELGLERLRPFENHPFKVKEDEAMARLIKSNLRDIIHYIDESTLEKAKNEKVQKQESPSKVSKDVEEVLTKYCDEIFASGAETEEFFYRLGIKDGLRLKSTVKSVLEMMS